MFQMAQLKNEWILSNFYHVKKLSFSVSFFLCVCVSHSVMSDSLQPHGLQPARLLSPRDCPGKNTGVGHHFLLQGHFSCYEVNRLIFNNKMYFLIILKMINIYTPNILFHRKMEERVMSSYGYSFSIQIILKKYPKS